MQKADHLVNYFYIIFCVKQWEAVSSPVHSLKKELYVLCIQTKRKEIHIIFMLQWPFLSQTWLKKATRPWSSLVQLLFTCYFNGEHFYLLPLYFICEIQTVVIFFWRQPSWSQAKEKRDHTSLGLKDTAKKLVILVVRLVVWFPWFYLVWFH